MCLLFYRTNCNAPEDGYSLILVNVRDEEYTRPTSVSSEWSEPGIFGPKDLLKGGTWMSMNKSNGKIAVLLNVLQPEQDVSPSAPSRGHLVLDYLNSDEPSEAFLRRKSEEATLYNGFVLVLFEMNQALSYNSYAFCNMQDKSFQLPPGTHAFGNSDNPRKPWNKVRYGISKFEEVVSRHQSISSKDELINDVFNMLSDRTRCEMDENMLRQGKGKPIEMLRKMSSLYVEVPEHKYGTRTWTIILVDGKGNADYIEKTMKEPIYCDSEKTYPTWIMNRHAFKIDQNKLH